MTAHIMQHSTEAWPIMASWVSAAACGGSGSTWSKRMASAGGAAAALNGNDSWEVRAFAEDASSSGQWPPRSYSCSFCQREFRTAQALGGHMNVHRRERAHANQLASLRCASARLSNGAATVELLSPTKMSASGSSPHNSGLASTTPLSSSPISQESISSSSELPLLQSIPGILSETLTNTSTLFTLAPSRGAGLSYHPYEKSTSRYCKPGPSQAGTRFSFCLNKVMNEHEDTLDLELRLGRSSCAVTT